MVLYGIIVILVCMEGWKENLFITSIAEMYGWLSGHLWIKRILMYGIFVFIAFVFTHMFIHFNLFYTESDSARYLLSALVQSQAAIIGIVITLTFIAIQLIFSHSPRSVGVALKMIDIWMLLIFYGISIFYGLFVLRMIPDEFNESLGQNYFLTLWGSSVSLEYRICFAYCLGVFTFVAIAPYILNTVDFLNPANIIKILSQDITDYKILKHIKSVEEHKENRTKPIVDDPVQPIADIIHGSVMRYDIATTSIGMDTIGDRAINVIDSHSFSLSAEFKNDLDSTIPKEFKNAFKKMGYPLVGSFALEKIDITGKKWRIHDESGRELYRVIVNENEDLTGLIDLDTEIKVSEHFCRHFKEIIRLTVKVDETPTIYAIKNLKSLGMRTAEKKLEYATKEVLHSLIGHIAIITERRFGDVTIHTMNSLRSIGEIAAENKLDDAVSQAVKYLDRVGRDAEENGSENVVWAVLEYIGQLGRTAVENELCHATKEAIGALEHFGKFEIEKKQRGRAERVLLLLERIGTVTVETREELEPVTRQASELEGVVKRLALSLIGLGSSAVENGDDSTTYESAKVLTELTISSEEVVRDEIDKISKYTPNYDSFQKFMQVYKLEKLRVKKSE